MKSPIQSKKTCWLPVTPGRSKTAIIIRGGISNACRFLFSLIGLALLCAGANGAVIFQADFTGTNAGTGGPNDLVTFGGTGVLYQNANTVGSVSNAHPFALNSGSYLNVKRLTASGGGSYTPALFTFAAASNSFAAWQATTNVYDANDNIQATVLHGALDVFVRDNSSASSSDMSPLRPLDMQTWLPSGGGGNGLEVDLVGTPSGGFACYIMTPYYSPTNPIPAYIYSLGAGASWKLPANNVYQITLSCGGVVAAGQVAHVGVTLDTDPTTGVTTAKLYVKTGAGAIDTAEDAVSYATFALDSLTVSNAFARAPWSFGPGWSASTPFDVDYDCARIYDSVPATFAALPGYAAAPQRGLVFEADFQGPGNGTGGSTNIVALGGTGQLVTTANVVGTITNQNPVVAGGANYLSSAVVAGYTGAGNPVTLEFASPANSWTAWQGDDIAGPSGTNYTQLHGAFDMFCCPEAFDPGNAGWCRPVDMISWSGGGGGTMQVILEGVNPGVQLDIIAVNWADGVTPDAILDFTNISNTTLNTLGRIQLKGGDIITAGTNVVYHIGFSITTYTNSGLTTAKLFLQTGTNAMDTTDATGAPVASATFRINSALVGSGAFVDVPWKLMQVWGASAVAPKVIDVASVRLYDTVPASFRALGAPLPAPLPPQLLPPSISGGLITVGWNGNGVLQSATNVNGSWASIPSATVTPYAETVVPGQNRFYRVLAQ